MKKERKILGKVIASLRALSLFFVVVSCNNTSPTSAGGTNNDGTVTDADGNVYHTITIGTQTWTVENLITTKYNDGTTIPHVTDSTAWGNLSTPAYCYYGNTVNADSIKKFGCLYNWYAVNTGKLAPTGWHVPTVAEWDTLQYYLIANGFNWDATTTGNKIAKAMAAKTDWHSFYVEGTIGYDPSKNNSSGFTALPGGFRDYGDGGGDFLNQSTYGYWWSTVEFDATVAWYRYLGHGGVGNSSFNSSKYSKSSGFSVRLVRD